MELLLVLFVAVATVSARPQLNLLLDNKQRIIGGTEAAVGEFPSQLSLRVNGSHICGATIISSNWAVTAAHCIRLRIGDEEIIVRPSQLTLLAGTVNLDGSNGGSVHQATSITVHDNYDPDNWWINDIAVIQVSNAFTLNGNTVATAKLAAAGQSTPDGSSATVIGWGATAVNGAANSKLLKVTINTVNRAECEEDYTQFGVTLQSSQLCAGVSEGGKGSCNMDSGGPLFVSGEVVGLVSWALGCATKGYPTIYTSVAAQRTWITTQTGV